MQLISPFRNLAAAPSSLSECFSCAHSTLTITCAFGFPVFGFFLEWLINRGCRFSILFHCSFTMCALLPRHVFQVYVFLNTSKDAVKTCVVLHLVRFLFSFVATCLFWLPSCWVLSLLFLWFFSCLYPILGPSHPFLSSCALPIRASSSPKFCGHWCSALRVWNQNNRETG